jgi:hypothetical protein
VKIDPAIGESWTAPARLSASIWLMRKAFPQSTDETSSIIVTSRKPTLAVAGDPLARRRIIVETLDRRSTFRPSREYRSPE